MAGSPERTLDDAKKMDAPGDRVTWDLRGTKLLGVLIAIQRWQHKSSKIFVEVQIAMIPSLIPGGGSQWNTWFKYNLNSDSREVITCVSGQANAKEQPLAMVGKELQKFGYELTQQS